MKVVIAYCYPLAESATYRAFAHRFASSFASHPPGAQHELHVITGGGEPSRDDLSQLSGLVYHLHKHDNNGWDIGAFQWAADNIQCDLLVCLGAHIHFHHDGWLARVVDSFLQFGVGMYGPWGAEFPTWHVRTTAFWLPPALLQSYPVMVSSARASRYRFEHGRDSMTQHTLDLGFPCVMVTMDGCFVHPDWPAHVPSPERSIILDKHHT
jgi:hypothetical protein